MSRRNRSQRQTTKKQQRRSGSLLHQKRLTTLQEWFLPDDGIFSQLQWHGNTKWSRSPRRLVWLALYWAWSESRNLTTAFTEAVECCQKVSGSCPLSTYQGFMGALVTWTSTFMDLLCQVLQARMKEIGGKFWQIDGWLPIAFDGSRSTAPRTRANEAALCAPNYGKGKTARYRKKKSKGQRRKRNQQNPPQPQKPQAWITMLWHMGLRLPWMWRLGPSNSSERAHVSEMLRAAKWAINTLFCGDAGFIGYPLWSEILQSGTDFLVRVGANVSLLTESANYRHEKNDIVLCWPKNQMEARQPPLRLRLVQVRIGKTKVWLLTSVLNPAELTIPQMIRLYKMRWGIEVEFRGLKQTLDRAKLRSRDDKRLLAELHWSILAMAVAELFALKEQLSRHRLKALRKAPRPDPVKRSLAKTMRALRYCLRHLHEVPQPEQDLVSLLRVAVTDSYQRKSSKRARYRPPNPDKKPLGDPQLRRLTLQEQKQLAHLTEKIAT